MAIRTYVNNDGEISTSDLLEIKAEIAKHRNHEIDIIIQRRQRTSQQNRALHWAIGLFSKGLQELGYKITPEDLKYELKIKGFFGWVEYETKNGTGRRPKNSHEMSTDECAAAFELLQDSARSYEIIIPDPIPEKSMFR